ncbi:MAG: pilus assembly protein PilM [Planctomycetota bacterium]|nr:pilus assembly protein PilM [Planctomycetota bacterium]
MSVTELASDIFHSLATLRPGRCKGLIGVDVGSHSTKLAQVERNGSSWRVMHRTTIPTPANQFACGDVNFDWLQDELRELVCRRVFDGRKAACVLPMSLTDLRTCDLPIATNDELHEIITLELEADDGLSHEFDAWNWQRRATQNGVDAGGMQPYSVVSVTTQLSDEIAECAFQAGLPCEVLDALPYVLARAVAMVHKGHDRSSLPPAEYAVDEVAQIQPAAHQPVGILDWGYATPLFVVVKNGVPVFARQLREGNMQSVIDSVARGINMEPQAAGTILTEYGLPDPDDDTHELRNMLKQFVAGGVQRLAGELNRTLGFLRGEQSNLMPDTIWLTGGGATIKNIDSLLENDIPAEIRVWRTRGNASSATLEPLYATAMALSALGVRS